MDARTFQLLTDGAIQFAALAVGAKLRGNRWTILNATYRSRETR